MLKPLLLFAGVRSLMALAIAWLLPLHDSRPLSATFGDLALYNGTSGSSQPLWSLPNPLSTRDGHLPARTRLASGWRHLRSGTTTGTAIAASNS